MAARPSQGPPTPAVGAALTPRGVSRPVCAANNRMRQQTIQPRSLFGLVPIVGTRSCLRRPTFLSRQESRQRTGQGGGRFRISSPSLDSPLIQTAKRGTPLLDFPAKQDTLSVFRNCIQRIIVCRGGHLCPSWVLAACKPQRTPAPPATDRGNGPADCRRYRLRGRQGAVPTGERGRQSAVPTSCRGSVAAHSVRHGTSPGSGAHRCATEPPPR